MRYTFFRMLFFMHTFCNVNTEKRKWKVSISKQSWQSVRYLNFFFNLSLFFPTNIIYFYAKLLDTFFEKYFHVKRELIKNNIFSRIIHKMTIPTDIIKPLNTFLFIESHFRRLKLYFTIYPGANTKRCKVE